MTSIETRPKSHTNLTQKNTSADEVRLLIYISFSFSASRIEEREGFICWKHFLIRRVASDGKHATSFHARNF